MKTSEKKPEKRRSPALTAGLILLFLMIVVLVTLAMLVSYDEVTNRFEAGKIDIVLTETKWDPWSAEDIVPNTYLDKNPKIKNADVLDTYVFLEVVVPYEDHVIIEDRDSAKGSIVYDDPAPVPVYKFVVTDPDTNTDSYDTTFTNAQIVHQSWKLLDGYPKDDPVNKTYTYVYAHVDGTNQLQQLMGGVTTQYPLFDKIYLLNFRERSADPQNNIPAFPDPDRDYSVGVQAYGIQANFLRENNTTTRDPEAVWEIIQTS